MNGIHHTKETCAGRGARLLTVAGLCAMGLGNAACGAAPDTWEESEADVTTEAIGEAACATAAPRSTATGYIRGFITSIDYTGGACKNSWIFDVNTYNATRRWTGVSWYDSLNTQSACVNAQVDAQLYVKSGSSWVKQGGLRTSRGTWSAGPFGAYACTNPGVTWTTSGDLVSGKSYRIVATGHRVGQTTTYALYFSSETIVH